MRQTQSFQKLSLSFITLFVLTAVSSFAQTRTTWSTAADIRSGARGLMVGTVSEVMTNSFTLVPDRDRNGPSARVTTDTIVTRYLGFGTGASEVFTGNAGFTRLRAGDRVEVRAIGDVRSSMAAEEILLLGRAVNQTAPQGSATTVPRGGTVEGVVRSISSNENRVVIETDRREMLTVIGTGSTPVYHEGNAYRIRNIEVGDRIRVEVESSNRDGIRARLIDVLRDATPDDTRPGSSGRTVTSIRGRVDRIDSRAQTFRLADDRGRIVVIDARAANDRAGNRFRLSDLQVGDRLEVSGEYDATNNFRADTIRFDSDFDRDDQTNDDFFEDGGVSDYRLVTLTGTMAQVLDRDTIVVRDNTGDRYRILVDAEFAVRNRTGGYIRASQLREGDRVELSAFRDRTGRYIAQTIRIR